MQVFFKMRLRDFRQVGTGQYTIPVEWISPRFGEEIRLAFGETRVVESGWQIDGAVVDGPFELVLDNGRLIATGGAD